MLMSDDTGHPGEGDVLFHWATSTDRVIVTPRKDIEMLKKAFLVLMACVVFLAIVMLVVVG